MPEPGTGPRPGGSEQCSSYLPMFQRTSSCRPRLYRYFCVSLEVEAAGFFEMFVIAPTSALCHDCRSHNVMNLLSDNWKPLVLGGFLALSQNCEKRLSASLSVCLSVLLFPGNSSAFTGLIFGKLIFEDLPNICSENARFIKI